MNDLNKKIDDFIDNINYYKSLWLADFVQTYNDDIKNVNKIYKLKEQYKDDKNIIYLFRKKICISKFIWYIDKKELKIKFYIENDPKCFI